MKKIIAFTTLSMVASSVLFASGWRIPEQSARSVALSGAYIANARGADSAYYNPANMSFNSDDYAMAFDLMYIHLTPIDYQDNVNPAFNGSSKSEDFFVPTIFLSSKDYEGWRFGLSVTAPGGLTKRWDSPLQKVYAQEFSLEIIEFNPVFSYAVTENISVGGGLRFIYSSGVVKSDGASVGKDVQRDMEGEAFEFGYNLALAYKFDKHSNFSLTYRSNVDINEEGNAKLYVSGAKLYDGGASVEIPLPAVLAAAVSYEFASKTTVEIEYDRTFWSEYKALDFEYKSSIPAILSSAFDDPKARNWDDSDAIRIGVTQNFDSFDIMVGFAYDSNPIPSGKVAYELPDSDAMLYSIGGEYRIDQDRSISFGYLYDHKKTRSDLNVDAGVNGEFSGAAAHLVSVGYEMKF